MGTFLGMHGVIWERKSIYTWDGHYNAKKLLKLLGENKDSEEGGGCHD